MNVFMACLIMHNNCLTMHYMQEISSVTTCSSYMIYDNLPLNPLAELFSCIKDNRHKTSHKLTKHDHIDKM